MSKCRESWIRVVLAAAALAAMSGCATPIETPSESSRQYAAGEPIMTSEQFAAMVRVEVRPLAPERLDELRAADYP